MAAGAIIGALAGLGSGAMQQGAPFLGQKMAFDYQKRFYRHRFQWMMKDLQRAGLNPILVAAQQGAGSMPSAPGAAPIGTDMAASAKQGALIAAEISRARSEAKRVSAEARKATVEADRAEILQSPYRMGGDVVNEIFDRIRRGYSVAKEVGHVEALRRKVSKDLDAAGISKKEQKEKVEKAIRTLSPYLPPGSWGIEPNREDTGRIKR